MASSRNINPEVLDSKYFDGVFDEMNRNIAHMHQDMKNAMHRITPKDLVSEGGEPLQQELEKIHEPVVSKEDGSKELCLQFDVGSFKPGEISVKTTNDGELQVDASHEEKSDDSRVCHKFSRHFTMPEGTNVDKLTSSLSKDGVLVVRGPVESPAVEQGAGK